MSIAGTHNIDRSRIERIVAEIVGRDYATTTAPPRPSGDVNELVVNISARHMHISQEDLEVLFGSGAELTVMRPLYQDGEFASEQTVDIIGPRRRMLSKLRILGPVRKYTQVELAFSDAVSLGIDVPVRASGNHAETPGCIVLGPKGHIELKGGVIRAQRHVHISPQDAERLGVANGEFMDLIVEHPTCPVTLGGILVRVGPGLKYEVHIDTDEGNACDLANATSVRLEPSGQRPKR